MEGTCCNDLLFVLEAIVEENTRAYKDDFELDIERILSNVESSEVMDHKWLWLSRPCGTDLLPVRDVFLEGSFANRHWTYYADHPEGIRAFAINLGGIKAGKVAGTLWELDYPRHVEIVMREALPVQVVSITFEDGVHQDLAYGKFEDGYIMERLTATHGSADEVVFKPGDMSRLERVIKANFPLPQRSERPKTREKRSVTQRQRG